MVSSNINPFDHSFTTPLKGTNNFAGNARLEELLLPSDNPAGGINFVTITGLHNPRSVPLNRTRPVTEGYLQSICP